MKKILIAVLLSLLVPVAAFASATEYKTGSMMFTFKGGATVPAFIKFFDNEGSGLDDRFWPGEGNTGLNVGGFFSLSFEGFTTPYLSLGGELGYNFNYDAGTVLFSMVPFFFKLTYYPIQGDFDMPISLGLGFSYWKYGTDNSLMTLYANVDIGFVYYFWKDWGVGIHTGLWLAPELNYTKTDWVNNALLGMIPVTLSVTYRS
ncbi:MAG: hypothetical protein WCR02_06110 [Sphaerochaetaceae bacterium]